MHDSIHRGICTIVQIPRWKKLKFRISVKIIKINRYDQKGFKQMDHVSRNTQVK